MRDIRMIVVMVKGARWRNFIPRAAFPDNGDDTAATQWVESEYPGIAVGADTKPTATPQYHFRSIFYHNVTEWPTD